MDKKKILLTMEDLGPKTVPTGVREFITKDSHVLEIGCGRGVAVIQLHREGHKVKGYEVEREYPFTAHKVCQEIGITWENLFDIGDAESVLPYDNASFDVVWTDQVLEHVKDLNFFLSEVARVLRPGGIFWARFPSKFNLIEPHTGLLMCSYSLTLILGPRYLKNSFNKLDAISSSGSRRAQAEATNSYLRDKVFFRTARKTCKQARINGLVKFSTSIQFQHLKLTPKGPLQRIARLLNLYNVRQNLIIFRLEYE